MNRAKLTMALTTLVIGLIWTTPAIAQDNPKVNMNDFVPSIHPGDIINVLTTRIEKGWVPGGGLWLAYRRNALTVEGQKAGSQVVQDQVVMDLYGSVSILGWGSVGLSVPVLLNGSGDSSAVAGGASGASFGDLRLSGKVKFWDNGNEGFGAGLGLDFTMPTASGTNYIGEETVTARTSLIADYHWNGWSGAANLGYFVRQDVEGYVPSFSDELYLSLGLIAPIICDRLEGTASSVTRTRAKKPFGGSEHVASNLLLGVRGRPFSTIPLVFSAAGGSGVGTLAGNPTWQMMVNVGYEHYRSSACDRDGDGVSNALDECPDVSGHQTAYGCPDRDRDGVLDDVDRCPDKTGIIALEGCPDRDQDGIADHSDQCPDDAGTKEHSGCPDSDGDGIIDQKDKCPKVTGVPDFAGCPDSDGDGIEDAKDDCKEDPGPVATNGCPDEDGDNIKDADDKCPDIPGQVEFEGCPPPTPETIKVTRDKVVILEKVQFATGRAKIMKESHQILKDVATVLKDNAWIIKMQIEGHTDDVGKHKNNVVLSQKRAEAVQAFLVVEGVEQARLGAIGYGPDKPLDPAKTKEARAANRRVEFTIIDPE
jgi:OmpA-OmpF porin, OOP family